MEEEEQGESSSSTCVTEESKSVSEELEHPWPYLASLFKFIAKAGSIQIPMMSSLSNENGEKGMFGVHEFPFKSQRNTLSICIRRMSHSTMNSSRDPASERRTTSVDRVQRNNA